MRSALILCLTACGHPSEPTRVAPVPPRDAQRPDAVGLADALATESPATTPVPESVVAAWSATPKGPSSPACIVGGRDRFIQYADVDGPGAVRFCLWWDLPDAHVGCWRVDLASGAYSPQTGVAFAMPEPPRVGLGGGAAPGSTTMPPTPAWLPAGADVAGYLGPSLAITTCDLGVTRCAWDLYEPTSGKRIAAVGGSAPLGLGATAAALDGNRFAAVVGTHLVVQDAATGQVAARVELPATGLHGQFADDVVFRVGDLLVVAAPDGRVIVVDPALGKITRTIAPPRCR